MAAIFRELSSIDGAHCRNECDDIRVNPTPSIYNAKTVFSATLGWRGSRSSKGHPCLISYLQRAPNLTNTYTSTSMSADAAPSSVHVRQWNLIIYQLIIPGSTASLLDDAAKCSVYDFQHDTHRAYYHFPRTKISNPPFDRENPADADSFGKASKVTEHIALPSKGAPTPCKST